jgi:hypothetical protein
MEIKDLTIKEPKKPTPLESDSGLEITNGLLKEWAVAICKSVEDSSESMSSGNES